MEVIERSNDRIEFKVTISDNWFEVTSYCKVNISDLQQFLQALELLVNWEMLDYEFIALYSNFEMNITMLTKTEQCSISGMLARDFLRYDEEYINFNFIVQTKSLELFKDTIKQVLSDNL